MQTAIIITGTICSGKSTISQKISKSLKIDLLDESNPPKYFFGAIDRIRENDFISPVIVEHTDILNFFDEGKKYDIGMYFDKKIIILINVSDDILLRNINDRKLRGVTGDYLNVDVIKTKREIENKFNEKKNGFIKYIANINIVDDYEHEYDKIIAFLSDCLRTE